MGGEIMKRKLTFLGYSFLFIFLLLANINRNSLSFNNSPQEKKEIINILSTYNTNLKNYIPLVISEVKGEITKLDRDNNSNNLLENIEEKLEQIPKIEFSLEKIKIGIKEILFFKKTILQRDEKRVLRL
mgnify:CR=1 FL=1|jgi:hypothetical protein